MKGNCWRAIASLLSAVILLVSVTYAWILSTGTSYGQFVEINFSGQSAGTYPLNIVSAEISVEFLYRDASGNFVVKEATDTTPLVLSGMVPNDMFPFKIRFYNQTGDSQNVALSISGIVTDQASLLTYMYVGTSGGQGYANATDANVVKPDNQFLCMSEATQRSSGEYDMRLYNSLIIPPTAIGSYVEVDGFFWFDREAKIELAGKTLTITNFRVLV